LIYQDDGVWRENGKNNSFGIELIGSLTEQLGGEYTQSFDDGTIYEFKLENLT
jgi:two-component sensor histidine kinase